MSSVEMRNPPFALLVLLVLLKYLDATSLVFLSQGTFLITLVNFDFFCH